MKRLITILLANILFCQFIQSCDNIIPSVDSIFTYHIKSLKNSTTDIPDTGYTSDDFDFLYMLVFFDNFDFQMHSYSLQPMITKKDVDRIYKWYKKNRKRINNDKLIKLLICLRKINHPEAFWIPESESFDEYIKSLDIELNEICEMKSFID